MQQRGRTLTLALAGMLAVVAGILAISAAWSLRQVATGNILIYPQVAGIAGYDIVTLTNEERAERNLTPLVADPLLTKAAQLKADDMAAGEYYAHVGPDGKGPTDWLKQVGYRYLNAGENLVIDRTSAAQAVSAWMGSPAHRENILRPQFTQIGVGIAEGRYKGDDTIFVVQVFGTPAATAPVVRAPKPVAAAPAPPKAAAVAPVAVEPVRLPSLAPKLEASATSTIPASSDSLVNRVTAIVTPAANSIRVESVPTTTTVATSTGIGTLVTMPGWANSVEFLDIGTATEEAAREAGLRSTFMRVRSWVANLWN